MFSGCTNLTAVPALPGYMAVNNDFGSCYNEMFDSCSSLIVSDTQTADAQYLWKIPTSNTFITGGASYGMSAFYGCAGTRASHNINIENGGYNQYYTQNSPIVPEPMPMYTVTYKAGDGSGSDYIVSNIIKGSAHTLVTLSKTGFIAPEGKVLDKWALGSASGTQYAAGTSYTVNEDTTFVAIYKDAPEFFGLCFTANTASSSVTLNSAVSPTLG